MAPPTAEKSRKHTQKKRKFSVSTKQTQNGRVISESDIKTLLAQTGTQ